MKADTSGRVLIRGRVRELAQAGALDGLGCSHFNSVKDVIPSADGCEDCLKTGDSWVHLRICLECGHVGCCDESKNKHARKHAHKTDHPVIASFEEGEEWIYCFPDDAGVEL